MTLTYSDTFFDYIEQGALRSARVVVPIVRQLVEVESVVDVGCGRGAWLSVWKSTGVQFVRGIDGEYVDRSSLLIQPSEFFSADLAAPMEPSVRFSLAQCLEVAEHLPPSASRQIVRTLTNLSDVVLFSAAVPGQGGENHINEREPEFWRSTFAEFGYGAYDVVRPFLGRERDVEPWYRYNVVLYANERGKARLTSEVASREMPPHSPLLRAGNARWKLRLAIVRNMPVSLATKIAKLKARVRTTLK